MYVYKKGFSLCTTDFDQKKRREKKELLKKNANVLNVI